MIGHYFVIDILVQRQPNTEFTSVCVSSKPSLEAALEEAFKSALYYLGICGYKVQYQIEKKCAACDGTGLARKVRGRGHKICPHCKGHKGALEVIGPVNAVSHEVVGFTEKLRDYETIQN